MHSSLQLTSISIISLPVMSFDLMAFGSSQSAEASPALGHCELSAMWPQRSEFRLPPRGNHLWLLLRLLLPLDAVVLNFFVGSCSV